MGLDICQSIAVEVDGNCLPFFNGHILFNVRKQFDSCVTRRIYCLLQGIVTSFTHLCDVARVGRSRVRFGRSAIFCVCSQCARVIGNEDKSQTDKRGQNQRSKESKKTFSFCRKHNVKNSSLKILPNSTTLQKFFYGGLF